MHESKGMGVAGCCVTRREESATASPGSLSGRERRARSIAGLALLALAAPLGYGSQALWEVHAALSLPLWFLSLAAGWFGLSHLVASITGYQGCPELGAIPSLFRRRPVDTRCAPWNRIDRRLR